MYLAILYFGFFFYIFFKKCRFIL